MGSDQYVQSFLSGKVNEWRAELEMLSQIACSQPHAAYAAFTHGYISKWTYLTRTMNDIAPSLAPLELVIRTKLIPAITSRPPPNDLVRDLLALPARLGGIAIPDPSVTSNAYSSSIKITRPLVDAILSQDFCYTEQTIKINNFLKRRMSTNIIENLQKLQLIV